MFDKNNIDEFDLMMKSILDEAREDVPERVWEGVSAGLDKAARRRTVVLWWRRAAIGAAAAAAVVLGVFFTNDVNDEFVPAVSGEDMIAVVEPASEVTPVEDIDNEEVIIPDEADEAAVSLLAEVRGEDVRMEAEKDDEVIPSSADEVMEIIENEVVENETSSKEEVRAEVQKQEVYFPEDWGEEETRTAKGVSLVLSGVTGTNNALSQQRLSPMKRPSVTSAPKKSGIDETSTKSSYGIPLSFGAGVKFDLNSKWSVGTGLNYTYLARQFYGKYTKVSATGDIEGVTSSDIHNQQHYIGIPVNVYYDIINNDRINFYAYAGGTVEKCVSDSYHLLSTNITHKEKINGVQLSADAGIGVEFMLGKNLGLYIDPSLRYYFENSNQPKSIRTVQPLMLGFEMGFRARL